MLCEEGMTTVEVKNALSLPQNIKQTIAKTQSNTEILINITQIVG
jgi:hypothetical protein